MTITKYGHCCLLLEIEGKRILTDPGTLSIGFETLSDIDIILITHEHADHCHTASIKGVLVNNPDAVVVTNTSVATLLNELGVDTHILEARETATVVDIALAAYDGAHVEIFEEFGLVQNTGYLIENTFFIPGDAYTVPDVPVKILALPVAGPWCKVSDAIYYALEIKPNIVIPIHDAVLSEAGKKITYGLCAPELTKNHVEFLPLRDREPHTF